MANKIKITLLSPVALVVDKSLSNERIVETMIEHWKSKLNSITPDSPDLVIVPEVCDRPAGMALENRRAYYEARGTQVKNLFAKFASSHNCHFVYSSVMPDRMGIWHNASMLLKPDGTIAGEYYKNHLIIEENTVGGLKYGKKAVVLNTIFGKVGFAICFDLNFETLMTQYKGLRPDLIVFSSQYHGGLMQPYWAYNCRSFFAGAVAGGPSEIRNPLGQVLATTTNYFDYVTAEVNLDCCLVHLDYNWHKIDQLRAKYKQEVKIDDPGYLGSVMITSEHKTRSAIEMIREFDIELLDDYFQRSLKHKAEHI